MNKNLVIISVPIARIARSSLSELVLSILRDRGDIVIVSPFSSKKNFKKNFSGENTFFIQWSNKNLSKIEQKFLGISERIRRAGYWRKYKREGMIWWLKTQYIEFVENGKDIKFGFFKSFIYWLLSVFGVKRNFWKAVEKLIGKSWYQFSELIEFTSNYDNVTLIQSANWGLQDRALSRLSMDNDWRKVLIPFTTDQLYCNGYLLNNFDAVCVQGEFELYHANKFHLVPEKSIYRLGSCWFRYLEKLSLLIENETIYDSRTIIYAGMGSLYFSRKSEYLALDALIKYINDSQKKLRLIYRPVISNDNEKNDIKNRYENLLEIQWPDESVIGLYNYPKINQIDSLIEYIKGFKGCKLLIMSHNTTICMDAAFLEKCGVISNIIDSDGRIERRHYSMAASACPPPVSVNNIDSLIDSTNYFLNNPNEARRSAGELISKWDYPDVDFKSVLVSAVYGKVPEL